MSSVVFLSLEWGNHCTFQGTWEGQYKKSNSRQAFGTASSPSQGLQPLHYIYLLLSCSAFMSLLCSFSTSSVFCALLQPNFLPCSQKSKTICQDSKTENKKRKSRKKWKGRRDGKHLQKHMLLLLVPDKNFLSLYCINAQESVSLTKPKY